MTGNPGMTRRQWLAFVALCMGFFVVQLDVTVVNVALEAIRHDIGGGFGGEQWVVASYTIALAAGMLTAGSLGDRYGARRTCVLGVVVFGVGSVLCSLSPTMPVLITARTVQGIGAATLMPCSLALIVRQFHEPRARAHALGLWGGIASIGLAAGPVAGGVLIALADWRAIFWVNVPFTVLTVVLTCLCVPESPQQRDRRLDPYGLVLDTVALSALAGGLIEVGQRRAEHRAAERRRPGHGRARRPAHCRRLRDVAARADGGRHRGVRRGDRLHPAGLPGAEFRRPTPSWASTVSQRS